MRVALVTTPPSVRSGIGDYTRHLLPYLRQHCQVDLFVRPEAALALEAGGDEWPGEEPKSILDLDPNTYDQVLYQLGNELNHDFMSRMIRHIGGVVMQHDWVLFDLALAAYPGLVRGGWKGHLLALREGGFGQAQTYFNCWLDRRRERNQPAHLPDCHGELGQLLAGWHGLEPAGRWIADQAIFRVPAKGVTRVEVDLGSEPGRYLSLGAEGGPSAGYACTPECAGAVLVLELEPTDTPFCTIGVSGIEVTAEQRKHGDSRRLGAFVSSVVYHDADGRHELDLSLPPKYPIRPVDLSRDRFDLPFNRSIVDHADAFIVHSNYVGGLIKARRGAHIPMGLLPHGSEKRWEIEDRGDRRALRAKLDLPEAWCDGFLVVSFGGVQPHKRIDRLLAGLALARETRDDIHMVLAGGWHPDNIDPEGLARMLGVEDAVHFTGYVPEEEAWDWIHAGDVSVNLRGPTSGGTSGGIYQSLSLGRAVIATGVAEQAELPADCIPKVPLGEGEVEAIAELLVELSQDPARCETLEAAARRYVEEDCDWALVGRRYHDDLASFPRTSVSHTRLSAMRAELEEYCGE